MNMVSAKPGFFVQDRFLYSKDNEKVVLRGVNHMFIWTDREGKTALESFGTLAAASVTSTISLHSALATE